MPSIRACGVASAVLVALVQLASAQSNWPDRTITAVVPFAAGAANDIVGRIVFDQVSKQVNQPIVFENRPGAGGTLGANLVAKSAPNGNTVLVHSSSFASALSLYKTLPYDTFNDFAAVLPLGNSPTVLVVAPSKGFKTVADLIAAAKAKPGELNFASAGIGAASHLAAEKFRVAAGIKAQHVPFKGPVEALTEVMAGRIDYYFLPIAPALPLIKDGKVTALAVSSEKRAPSLPDVPTVIEIGLPGAVYAFWNGVFVPVKTPADIVARLYAETQTAIADASVKERLAKLGIEPLVMSQPEFERYFKADVLDTDKLAKEAGIEKQ
jgi:tripartite-type tricarboxylate transporter receptor subunit TctC